MDKEVDDLLDKNKNDFYQEAPRAIERSLDAEIDELLKP